MTTDMPTDIPTDMPTSLQQNFMLVSGLFLATVITAFSSIGIARAAEVAKIGDFEMHSIAVPTTELSPEAAKEYNVTPAAGRGLLTVALIKKGHHGEASSVAGQVYAGAVTQGNRLFSIPIREVHHADQVYYLGEFRVEAPDTLRFLVNANVLGKPMKVEFSQIFSVAN
jgi:hypothetical protein